MIIRVNRAPVMTLWASVVAERLGFDEDEALTIGKAVAGLNAHAKGVRLGICTPDPEKLKKERKRPPTEEVLHVEVLHRAVPVVRTKDGLRALRTSRRRWRHSRARSRATCSGHGATNSMSTSAPPFRQASGAGGQRAIWILRR
jgi:hypothetical protein